MPLEPGDSYQLTKSVWTHDDFEEMGWHDVFIHAVSSDAAMFEFILDIDYIFAWVNPEPPSPGYSFWISPATLVFQNVRSFHAEMDGRIEMQILDVRRENPRASKNADHIPLKIEWDWTVELVCGELCFPAAGYTQHIRQKPRHVRGSQLLKPGERGGISFERTEI